MVMLMPLPVVMVPQFVIANFMGIQRSALAIILPAAFSPFGVFLLRQYLKSLPPGYTEAARIDGAGHIRILVSIIAPLLKSAIAALAILVFVDYWNVVEQAIVFLPDLDRQPLSLVLTKLDVEVVFAASCFYMLPAVLVFLNGQEYFVEGIQLSGLKG